jgi:signal peptidase I
MAETLWGYQKVVTCPECGIKFPVSCSREVDPQEGQPRTIITHCTCPNCRKEVHLKEITDAEGHLVGTEPSYTTGDRVLVAKFVYDLFNHQPDRLDVVVFKFPGDGPEGPFPHTGPYKGYTPMNYIKRLIGLPGETIAICGGKLYVLSAKQGPHYDDLAAAHSEAERTMLSQLLWRTRYMHINEAVDLFKQNKFEIIRKSPENILGMKRLVYDNDHPARDLPGPKWQRWKGDGWTANDNHGFRHTVGAGSPQWLRYHHILRDTNGKEELITDFLGYNSAESSDPRNWVGDLVLECEASIDQPQGDLILELSHGIDRFQAQWNLADGVCTLSRLTQDQAPQKLASKSSNLKKGTHQLRFANVDQRLFVWIDERLVWTEGVEYPAPATPRPTTNDLEPASIGVQGMTAHVKHLKLFRDVYYTYRDKNKWDIRVDNPEQWRDVGEPPVETYYVQPDHFLCLGDNSPQSSDGRSWGLVPRRLLLGRALMVYYPFYFPYWPLDAQVNRVGLIH